MPDINYQMPPHVIMTFHILAAVLLEVEKPFDVLPTNFRFFLANQVPYKAPETVIFVRD